MTEHLFDRATARLLGERHYQGTACLRGHPGSRFTATAACTDCTREAGRARLRDPEFVKRDNERKQRAKREGRWHKPTLEQRRAQPSEVRHREAAAKRTAKRLRAALVKERARRAEIEARKAARAARLASPEHKAAVKHRRDLYNRAKSSKRRALKRGANGATATSAHIDVIGAAQGWRCAYCGDPDNLHLDHMHPASRGGGHHPWNLQWLCAFHNLHKRVTPDAEYRRRNGIPAITPWDRGGRALWFAIFAA